jgi:hypothetical protein
MDLPIYEFKNSKTVFAESGLSNIITPKYEFPSSLISKQTLFMLACDKKTASRTPTSPDTHRSMLGPQAYSHFGGQAFIPSQMRIGWSRNSIFMMAY